MYENAHEVETLINAVTRAVQGPCYAGMGRPQKPHLSDLGSYAYLAMLTSLRNRAPNLNAVLRHLQTCAYLAA